MPDLPYCSVRCPVEGKASLCSSPEDLQLWRLLRPRPPTFTFSSPRMCSFTLPRLCRINISRPAVPARVCSPPPSAESLQQNYCCHISVGSPVIPASENSKIPGGRRSFHASPTTIALIVLRTTLRHDRRILPILPTSVPPHPQSTVQCGDCPPVHYIAGPPNIMHQTRRRFPQ